MKRLLFTVCTTLSIEVAISSSSAMTDWQSTMIGYTDCGLSITCYAMENARSPLGKAYFLGTVQMNATPTRR